MSLRLGTIVSEIYKSASEFSLETYCLGKNSQLVSFLRAPNEGHWITKNTSMDKDCGISLIDDIENFKKSMLLKVRRGPREKL